MKELQKVILTILLVFSSLVAIAAADPTMSVSEQPAGIAIGETFTAEVTVDPAGAEIYAAQYDLRFDPTIMEAIEQSQGTFLSQGGVETIVASIPDEINNTIGKIQYAETRTDNPETVGGATGSGLLASVTFKVIGDGISTLTLSNVAYVTPDDLMSESVSEPPASDGDDGAPDAGGSSHSTSGGSYGEVSVTTPTPSETPPTTSAPHDRESGTTDDHITTPASDETGSTMAESVPTAAPAKTPLPPEATIPGFAAPLAILGMLAVAIILKSRVE